MSVSPFAAPVVVIGGSAGALVPLQRCLAEIPPDLGAAILVVLHTPAGISVLAPSLERHSSLPLGWAKDGQSLEVDKVFVAPGDSHLVVESSTLTLLRGPKVNRQRPSLDSLFRSAAQHHGNRVVAVLLSGLMDDGVAGLLRIKGLGGKVIVQHPEDAAYADLPRAALRELEADAIVYHQNMAAEITLQVNAVSQLSELSHESPDTLLDVEKQGPLMVPETSPEPFTCPLCHGNMWSVPEGDFDVYRCRIGHVFSTADLSAAIDQEVESSMWVALRNLEEAASVSRRLAHRTLMGGLAGAGRMHSDREKELMDHANVLRTLLEGRSCSPQR